MMCNLKKVIFIAAIAAVIFAGLFLGAGVYYSTEIIHPKEITSPASSLKRPKAASPKDYDLDYEDCFLKTEDNLFLKGWYIRAQNKSDKGIILAHGYGAGKVRMLKYAPFLTKAGFNVLLFDLRGHGENKRGVCSLGYYEQKDILAAADFLYEKGITKIGILAESLGASVSILAMAKDKRIKAGVFDSAFCDAEFQLLHYGRKLRRLPAPLIKLAIFITEKRLNYKMRLASPLEAVRRISPRQVFFIHGQDDKITDVYNSIWLYQEALFPKDIWITKNNGHNESFLEYQEEYENKVAAFFDKYL